MAPFGRAGGARAPASANLGYTGLTSATAPGCKGLSPKWFPILAVVTYLALASVRATPCTGDGDCTNGGSCCNNVCGVQCGSAGCCPTSLGFNCTGASSSCGASLGGTGDPHFLLTAPQSGQELNWDFHGKGNQSYCMISDNSICLNAHMFNLPPDVTIVHPAAGALDSFFEGTWMDGIGVIYSTPEEDGENALEVVLNQTRARAASDELFAIRFKDKDTTTLVPEGVSEWTSPDGTLTLRYDSEFRTSVEISIPNQLIMDVWVEADSEMLSDPLIYSLSFDIKSIATTPEVHGFVGQMYAPGAFETRLQMGTLEGLLHREYVEGTDDDYATSGLTSTDCFFNRFKTVKADVTSRTPIDFISTTPGLSLTGRRLLAAPAPAPTPSCDCLCGGSSCAAGDYCCNNGCTNVTSDAQNCGACGKACASYQSCCGGNCTYLDIGDNSNCGACGNACASGQTCCNSKCVDYASDTNNCGGCGYTCPPYPGTPGNWLCCAGRCIDATSDSGNCGYCGSPCDVFGGESCCAGTCCTSGQICCGGTCKSPFSDPNNCGFCGNACSIGQSCCENVGGCVDTTSNFYHCGSCGKICAAGESCCGGNCCAAGESCCGSNCCAAGRQCCGSTCCASGQSCCDGVCTTTTNNDNNCGVCGNGCVELYQSCCGSYCCPTPSQSCCGSYCCPPGWSCCGSGGASCCPPILPPH